jgi:trigger factor
VYPEEEITSEEAFRNKVKEDAEKAYERESERLLMVMASEDLVENVELDLPHEFLKRWLVQNDENLTAEKVEAEYDKYAKTMKWQLIENKIIKENDIEVKDEEVKDQIRKYFMQQMGGGSISEDMQKQLEPIVDSMMQNKEQTKQIYDQLFDEKISKAIKENVNLNEKDVSYEEFIKMAQAQQHDEEGHDHNHEEDENPEKSE